MEEQTKFEGWSGGYRTIACPSCGKPFTWSAALAPTHTATCNAEQGRDEKRCQHTMRASDLNYLWWKERNHANQD